MLTTDGGRFWRIAYARVPDELVGSTLATNWIRSDAQAPMTVVMQPSREVRGRVTAPDGFDRSKAVVRVLSVAVDGRAPSVFPRNYSFPGLHDCLPERFDAQVATDGSFVLRDVPKDARLYLSAEADGLGHAQWFCYPGNRFGNKAIPELIEIAMRPEGVVAGVVRGLGNKPAAGVVVRVEALGQGVRTSWTVTTDDAGRYRHAGLSDGRYRVAVESDAALMRPFDVVVVAGKTHDHDLQLERGAIVAGRVVDDGGEPVAGARVGAVDPYPYGERIYLGSAATDERGRFELKLPSGPAELYFSTLPDGFVYPQPQAVETVEVGDGDAATRGLELVVERAK